MNEFKKIQSAIDRVIETLSYNEYSISTIKNQKYILQNLLNFMKEKKYYIFDEKVGVEYIYFRTNQKVEGFWGNHNRKINYIMKPLQNLLKVLDGEELTFFVRSHIKPFECPKSFKEEYIRIQKEFTERGYAKSTIIYNNNIIHKLLPFLEENNVSNSSNITIKVILKFLENYKTNKPKYISTILCVLRNYLSFLYNNEFIKIDISKKLPHVKIIRNAFIPHSWKAKDVKKLLNSIDRGSPKGKRDYAIILLITRLGLRVSDIRSLELTNLNWVRKTITLISQKSQKHIELPLLDDIGWAIIDYLKNGRPKTTCKRIFVRHRAPYDAVGENENFHKELHRYMRTAQIKAPSGVACGLHSLRSTLARKMLETGASLPVISETLGHSNINTTSIYIKIDLEGLKKCALDPEEVFDHEQ